MDKTKFNPLVDEIVRLKDQIKDINGDIKVAIEAFAKREGMTEKAVKKGVAEIIDFRKNKDEYILVDQEISAIVNSIVYPEV
jgi:dihydropteroate synthase